ncbi:MAG: CHASE2 domain-containing protein [Coleofasciculus sp. B1-GNL1-01]|uniref:CHASE2 domain-containing protein n=1 Tax=Coleofasciculus sp. B1-GNL1-01 TaxID=3068484 RepID=UPI0032F328DA
MISEMRSFFSQHPVGKGIMAFGGTVVLTSVVVTGVIVGLRQLGALEGAELDAYDQLVRSRPESVPSDRVLVVGISEEDIRNYNQFPITDATLATVLKKLADYQPRAIGIDIGRDVPIGEGREDLIQVIEQNDNMVAACVMSSATEPGTPPAPGVPPERVGFADMQLDQDQVIRRTALVSFPPFVEPLPENPHLCQDPDSLLYSLPFRLATSYLEQEGIEEELTTPEEFIKLDSTIFLPLEEQSGNYSYTGAFDYQIMINWSGENAIEQVTLTDVLEDNIDPNLVTDRVVLVGYTASTANDDFATPFSAAAQDRVLMPGVVLHAQVVSQILSTVLEGRPLIWYWSQGTEILWIFLWSVVGGTLAWKIRRPWILIPVAIVAGGVLYGISYAVFVQQAGWIPLVPPTIGLALTTFSVVIIDRYGQVVAKTVKKLLRINIEIDETQREEQVNQVVNTDTFQDLQIKAQELKKRRDITKKTTSSNTIKDRVLVDWEEAPELGQYQQLLQRARVLRHKLNRVEDQRDEIEETDHSTNGSSGTMPTVKRQAFNPEDESYLSQLQSRGRRMRNR